MRAVGYTADDAQMMTVITHVKLRPGDEPEWDAAMRERLEAAKGEQGWIGGQLLIPTDALNERVIVGTWETRADWEAWHEDPAFRETRERLEGLQSENSSMTWYEVVREERSTD
jgi:heme-degrading monooxygenase HmoA